MGGPVTLAGGGAVWVGRFLAGHRNDLPLSKPSRACAVYIRGVILVSDFDLFFGTSTAGAPQTVF